MGIAGEQAAFIGNDMRNDIAPAHAAGLQTVLFAGDARSLRLRQDDPCCRDLQPDLRITHLNQLASFISNARPQTTWG
jgi:putative hydrolase of the HAD superfamily